MVLVLCQQLGSEYGFVLSPSLYQLSVAGEAGGGVTYCRVQVVLFVGEFGVIGVVGLRQLQMMTLKF